MVLLSVGIYRYQWRAHWSTDEIGSIWWSLLCPEYWGKMGGMAKHVIFNSTLFDENLFSV